MELRVKLLAKDIFIFSLYHFYKSAQGAVSIGCAALAAAIAAVSWPTQPEMVRLTFAIGVVLVIGSQPFMLYRKAVKQAMDPEQGKEVSYKLDYNGMRVQQGKDRAVIYWNQVVKVGRRSGLYVLYLNKARAYLIPDRVLSGDKKEQFLKIIRQYVAEEKRKGI